MDIARELRSAIAHRIACIDRPYLNAFAGTGRSQRRHAGDIHAIARKIMDRTFDPFSFFWDIGNGEPAGFSDVYLTVFTALFDIDDDDARRWTSKAEWDVARSEAARDITRALLRKFTVTKRALIISQNEHQGGGFGDAGSAHGISNCRYEDEREW
ncbi:hypothetical protein PMI07_000906 [Rhizobium sp. CF080]|nr:hypothetical protein PMI07_000906 [Rhizobium sp. CF080]